LKATQKEKTPENILAPFLNSVPGVDKPAIQLSVKLKVIKKELVAKLYPRTVHLLEVAAANVVSKHFEKPHEVDSANEIIAFVDFTNRLIQTKGVRDLTDRLNDVFSLEKAKLAFFQSQKSFLQVYLDTLLSKERSLHYLNQPNEWLLQQKVAMSDNIKSICTKWDWSLDAEGAPMDIKDMLKKHVNNLINQPKEYEYVFQVTNKFENLEFFFKPAFRLLLHRFDETKTLGQAMMEIRHYIQSLPVSTFSQLLFEIGVPQMYVSKDLQNLVAGAILRRIRIWIHKGTLTMV
jgi:hypothetical protein